MFPDSSSPLVPPTLCLKLWNYFQTSTLTPSILNLIYTQGRIALLLIGQISNSIIFQVYGTLWWSPHCLNREFLLSFKLKNKPAAWNTVSYFSTFRRSHPEVLLWKSVLKICSKFTEHPCWSVKVWIVICRWQNHNFVEILKILEILLKHKTKQNRSRSNTETCTFNQNHCRQKVSNPIFSAKIPPTPLFQTLSNLQTLLFLLPCFFG